ncbi:MAG: dihydroneopterin aldolase [Dehalococcoidia bacterium]|nr:dihydroneopterin aldolase [Dehalococcoidia bacterium]
MPPDSIQLEGMVFYAYHGRSPAERELGQRFIVDLEVQLDLRQAGASDRIEDTVHYAHLYRMVKEVVEGPPRHLLEAVAEEVARRVLEQFPQVETVRIRIAKPGVAIKGSVLKEAAVAVERKRE